MALAPRGDGISRRRLLVCLLAWPLALVSRAATPPTSAPIHLILSDTSAAYTEVAEAFRAGVRSEDDVQTTILSELVNGTLAGLDLPGRLLVPVGVRAAKAVAAAYAGRASVLVLLVPKTTFAAMRWPVTTESRISAVYIDQPLMRSLHLIRQLLPRAERLGAIISSENTVIAPELRRIALQWKLELDLAVVTDSGELSRALPQVLSKAEVLLLLPDARVINENSARVILLEAYRRRIPVVGFSRGLVNAGAVASVYSAPAQIGREGALLAGQWNVAGAALPEPRHASQYSLALNPQVARSLGMVLPKEAELRLRLQEGGNGHLP